MKPRKLTLMTLLFLCCISCNEKNKKQINETKSSVILEWKTDFQIYLNQIPFLKLPLDFECSKGFIGPDIDLTNDNIKKYKPDGATIIGKIYQDENEVAIIYGYPADIFYPIISVFDNNGKKIKEVLLFEESKCVGDAGYYAKTIGTITADYKIKTKTITYRWNPEIKDSPKDSTIIEDIKTIK